jgi:molybdopterin-guanine dinucleotide biosynthesis protein A
MGSDKALIKLGDKNMLEMVINVCQSVCDSIIISSNNPDHGRFGYPVVADEIMNCGPIGGILSCLKVSETDWNFIISVDTPFVTDEFIRFLSNSTKNCDVVVPFHSGGKEPLIALYSKGCLPVIEHQTELRQFKIHQLIRMLNTKLIDADKWLEKTPRLFKNLNRPEDVGFQK